MSRDELSPPSRSLAVVLAVRCRLMADGSYAVWRGSKSLADVTGLHRKTVDRARRELLNYGLFQRRRGRLFIPGADEPVEKHKARRVIALTLVRDVRAYRDARKANRASAPAGTAQVNQGFDEPTLATVDVADHAQVERAAARQPEHAPPKDAPAAESSQRAIPPAPVDQATPGGDRRTRMEERPVNALEASERQDMTRLHSDMAERAENDAPEIAPRRGQLRDPAGEAARQKAALFASIGETDRVM